MTTYSEPMRPEWYRVLRRRHDTADTLTLELEPQTERVQGFLPGQFNMLYVFGVGEVPISISGDPTQPQKLVHTTRAVGAVTQAICGLKRHEMIGVRGPFGTSWPVADCTGKDVVLIAGGIGLAPLRPVIYHLLAQREQYGNIVILYGTRTPADMLYPRQLAQWRGRFDVSVDVTVDHAPDTWRGHVGVVTKLIPNAPFDPHEAVAMICGPEVMMRFTIAELRNRGLPEEQIFVSMERNMKCAIGFCGHCQFGPSFICKDGPVMRYDRIKPWFGIREF
ncbi:MAG: oxidoreductase [Candidatus Entotheonella factor]|uniref:Oxidoreductase n=1 Tax=Entotheonella factor TaxID=1429438 RepID=W4L7K8_ENTF1|nr:FAD/NAD(P)-binding protein [Candidatus Entotheonella palauensis]ETW94063.1 MAG: oxidoreductase [Candidatus Entotheonella factor]